MKNCFCLTALFLVLIGQMSFAQFVIVVSPQNVCVGELVKYTAAGCNGEVRWSTGEKGLAIIDTLFANISLSAVCVENELTSQSNLIELKVKEKPNTPFLFCNVDEIKKGKSATITTFGCNGEVFWNTGATGRTIEVTPAKTSTYTAWCENENGCKSDPISRTIIVYDKKNPETPEVAIKYACTGETVLLKAAGCTAGEYVWYKNESNRNKGFQSTEIGRGNEQIVTAGGDDIYYTARCFFSQCLGDESNRLVIDYNTKIDAPQVILTPYVLADGSQSIDLNNYLAKPKTTSGKFEFRQSKNFESGPIVDPTNIRTPGNYYVFEVSSGGNCLSAPTRIQVQASDNAQLIKENEPVPAALPVLDAPVSPVLSQPTDMGAVISAEVPNSVFDDLVIPEGFSPNGDNKNDVFVIKDIEKWEASLRVYNRYGHLVYFAENYQNNWDGSASQNSYFAATGLPDGTYYYALKLKDGRQKISFLILQR